MPERSLEERTAGLRRRLENHGKRIHALTAVAKNLDGLAGAPREVIE
jgi:hypothetical protein